MRKLRRALIGAAAGVAMLGLGWGCGRRPDADPGETRIRIQIHWDADSPRGRAIRAILDEFERANPGVSVRLLGGSGDDRRLLSTIAGGNPPDVIETSYRNVGVLGRHGALRPLDELAGNADQFYPALWELGLHEGRLYGYPWFGHTIQLIYNKDLFKEAGVESPPGTWDELLATARRLTRDTTGDGRPDRFGLSLPGRQHGDLSWMFAMFLHQAGGRLAEVRDGRPRVALNSPEGLKALRFYLQLVKEACPPGAGTKMGGDVMADFRSQVAAMQYQGPWGVTDIWQQPEEHRFRVGAAPVPAGPGGRAAELGANMTVIPSNAKHPEKALALIEFLGGREAQALLMAGEETDAGFVPFRVPVRTDLDDLPFFERHPEFLPFVHGFAEPSIEVPLPEWARVRNEVLVAELNRAVLGRATPEEALEAIQRQGDRLLGE